MREIRASLRPPLEVVGALGRVRHAPRAVGRPSHLEQVHRSVAIVHKGMKDGSKKLDRYINVKKKKSSWNTLVYGAPTPWDDRYPETMPDE